MALLAATAMARRPSPDHDLTPNRTLVCGTCMDARGLTPDDLVEGAMRSTLDELTQLTLAADKILTF